MKNVIEACGMLLAIPFAAVFGILAHRLWTFLVVKKLHWMTQEEVERFNNKRQFM